MVTTRSLLKSQHSFKSFKSATATRRSSQSIVLRCSCSTVKVRQGACAAAWCHSRGRAEIATKHRKRAIAAHRLLQRRELDDEEDYADGTEHAEKAMQLLGKTIVQRECRQSMRHSALTRVTDHASVKKLVGALVALPAELYDKQQARRLEELLEALREDEELLERDAAEVHKTWGELQESSYVQS